MADVKARSVRVACVMTLIVLGTALVWTEDRVTDPLRVVTPPRSVDGRRVPTADPFDLVSSTSLLHFLEDLTDRPAGARNVTT
jgi:hypothetical protein